MATKNYLSLYRKSTRGDNFTHTSTPRTFTDSHIFGMWGLVADIVNHANFYLNRSKGYTPQGGRNLPHSIDLMYRPYDSVSTNVLHCD